MSECMLAVFWLSKDGMASQEMAMNDPLDCVQTLVESVRTALIKLKKWNRTLPCTISRDGKIGIQKFGMI